MARLDLNDAVFGVEVNEHLVHHGSSFSSLQITVRVHRKQRLVLEVSRWRKKALETEGNRSCKTGFYKSSTVDRRRSRIRSNTKRLLLQDEQERESRAAIKSALTSKSTRRKIRS